MITDQSKETAPKKRSIRPHMLDSPEAASLWFDIFNGVLFIGALLVTVGTWGTIKTAGIKEKFSDERIAANEAETKRAIAESDLAKQGAAEANARAAEAQLALEKFKSPRKLDDGQASRIKAAVSRFSGTPFDMTVNLESEPESFAAQIGTTLEAAGWVWKDRNNTPGLAINIGKHQAGILNGGPPLAIEIDVSKSKDWEQTTLILGKALGVEGFVTVLNKANDNSASPDAIHTYVGSKR
jgi:hypothetical protein